jgi:hypothetical protein
MESLKDHKKVDRLVHSMVFLKVSNLVHQKGMLKAYLTVALKEQSLDMT